MESKTKDKLGFKNTPIATPAARAATNLAGGGEPTINDEMTAVFVNTIQPIDALANMPGSLCVN